MSVTACGAGWTGGPAGDQRFTLHDTDSRAGEVQLVGAGAGTRLGAVYADVEPVGPGTRTGLEVRLGAGRYSFRCLMEDEAAVTGPVVALHGHVAHPAPGVRPVTQTDLIGPTRAYESYVRRRLVPLTRSVDRLRAAIAHGRRPVARRSWLLAHLDYERLGAAYGAFGPLDAAIDGDPAGLRHGVHDARWTGFHRVERGLWHAEPTSTLLPAAARLRADVHRLRRVFDRAEIDPATMAVRAHEISENALQVQLTGRDDFGSHSGLASVGAALDGTTTVLGLLRPLLRSRVHDLPAVRRDLARARGLVRRAPAGSVKQLPQTARESIDAVLGDLCERLATVASILEPRRTS